MKKSTLEILGFVFLVLEFCFAIIFTYCSKSFWIREIPIFSYLCLGILVAISILFFKDKSFLDKTFYEKKLVLDTIKNYTLRNGKITFAFYGICICILIFLKSIVAIQFIFAIIKLFCNSLEIDLNARSKELSL